MKLSRSGKLCISLAVAAGTSLVASSIYAHKAEQLEIINGYEIEKRKAQMTEMHTASTDKEACAEALKTLDKPFVQDRTSFLLAWEAATDFSHYGTQYKAALEACSPQTQTRTSQNSATSSLNIS